MTDEHELIRKAQGGDRAAFERLIHRYQDRLYTSVMHVVQRPDEAEDIVQDAFVQAMVHLPQFKELSSFYTWIYRIAFNRAMNRRKRAGPTASLDDRPSSAHLEPVDPGDRPGDPLEREERIGEVRHALSLLSESHRAVLVLREIEGFDYQRIARVLDISIGTVRSRLSRARQLMREHLSRPRSHHGSR